MPDTNQQHQQRQQPQIPDLQTEEVHLQDYLNVIYRRRKTFLLSFLAVFLGVALYTFTMKPVFEASATLHVKDEKAKSELLDALAIGSANPVDAELEILKSRTNAEKVVQQMHLDWRILDRPEDVTFRLLEFIPPAGAEDRTYTVELTGGGYLVRDSDGKLMGYGRSGVLFRGGGLTLLLDDLRGEQGRFFGLKKLSFNGTVNRLRKNIKAAEVRKKTNIITVSYTNTDPALARDVVNTLVRVYLDQSVGFKTEEANRTVAFLEDQLHGLRGALDSSEKNLQAYKTSAGVVQLDSAAQEVIAKLSETEKERTAVGLRKKQTEFALASLNDAMRRGTVYMPAATADNPVIAGMAGRLAELEVQRQGLLTEATENHPAVKTVKGQIDELQRKIKAAYESELSALDKREADIGVQLGRYEGMLRSLPEAERDLARLTRVTKVNADIYTFLLQKHEEARIAKASTISNIAVVDPAISPDEPVKPQKGKNLLLGLLGGCMLGVGLAFFQEYLDDTIKDVDTAKKELRWPLLAVIPCIEHTGEGERERKISLIAHAEPKSQVSEAFRSLRTGIHFSSISRKKQVLLVTSTFPGEGKSTVSANLACILAQTGDRVVVVDCDLRRSTLHQKFGLEKEPGLTNLLAGDNSLGETLRQTPIPNLFFLSAGATPPNPAELLGSREMADLISNLRDDFDLVLVDAPPVLAVTDAPLLTALADIVMVIVETGRVPVKAARQMRETLESVGAPVAGMILNDKTGKGRQGYGYGHYGGKYGYYGYGYYGYGYHTEPTKDAPAKWWQRLPERFKRS